jgi:hypothetical protein
MAGLSLSWLKRCGVSPNPMIVIPAQSLPRTRSGAGIQGGRSLYRVTKPRMDTGLRRCDEWV